MVLNLNNITIGWKINGIRNKKYFELVWLGSKKIIIDMVKNEEIRPIIQS